MNFGSLFAGIGGFDLGFERAGMRCAWQVEIDNRCNQVLAHHWPDVKRYGDVRDVGRRNLETVDLICGGFPCQDVSVAGRREGLDGERSGLWFEFLRVVEELKPRWVVVENVPGLLSSNERRDFATILSGLAECGHMGAYRIFDAQYFGVPQRRRRVFVVGCLGDWSSPAEVLFERESSLWDTPPRREAGAGVADPITKSFAKHHGRSAGKDSYPRNMILAKPLNAHAGRGQEDHETFICNTFNGYTGGADDNDAQGRHLIYVRNMNDFGINISPTIRTPQGSGSEMLYGVRRLVPLETERLQGFPDNFTAVDGMSDSGRYRMLGNAVAVPVAEWLGRRIVERNELCST